MGILDWRGGDVAQRVADAARKGVDETTAAAVIHAKQNHPWQNVTGTAEGSIQMRPAEADEDGSIRGEWGSYGVDYFLHLELGTVNMPARPALRPAADAEYPNLAARIKAALEDA
jgi:hypothetical protein